MAERNDGPAIDLGGGENEDFVVTYVENGPPVAIGLSHLIEVMDEEGNNVSSVTIELVSTNGELDAEDFIYLGTPMALPFVLDPNTVITGKLINITLTGDGASYTQAIQSVRYVNTREEPTLFVNGTTNLSREVVIRITDASTVPSPTTNEVRVRVRIEPINDNAPRIIINSDPVCTEDCRDSGVGKTISRRSIGGLRRGNQKRKRRRRRSTSYDSTSVVSSAPYPRDVCELLCISIECFCGVAVIGS